MSTPANWIHSPQAEGLAWALVHFLWQGVLVAALLAVTLAAFRRRPATWRYAAACAALLLMPATFAVTLALMIPERARTAALWQWWDTAAPAGGPDSGFAAGWAAGSPWADRIVWLVPVWMACVLVLYARTLGGWLAARRLRTAGAWPVEGFWQGRLHQAAARLRISKPVRLLESCLAEAPVVIGYFRPVILVPAGLLAGLPAAQMEAVLAHELAHIRRHDYLVNLLENLVEGLLFYHPAVWWVSARIRAERENCCDDVAVAWSGDARGYAAALAALEERRWPPAPALAATGGRLMDRILRLLNRETPRPAAAPVLGAALLLVLAAWMAFAWNPPTQTAAAGPLASPYEKWVKEDVAYIITARERKAFQALATGEEREHFIQQFWQRRDPTPGTPRNEFKDEHYRRIAYANQRFPGTNMPGWTTDRGRIYITFGPPDEIESHPGPSSGFPYEVWLYHWLEGLGRNLEAWFVDPENTGDYRLTPAPRRQ